MTERVLRGTGYVVFPARQLFHCPKPLMFFMLPLKVRDSRPMWEFDSRIHQSTVVVGPFLGCAALHPNSERKAELAKSFGCGTLEQADTRRYVQSC